MNILGTSVEIGNVVKIRHNTLETAQIRASNGQFAGYYVGKVDKVSDTHLVVSYDPPIKHHSGRVLKGQCFKVEKIAKIEILG